MVVVLPVDKLIIIETKNMVTHMLYRSSAVGPNTPTTSAIFTMCRSPSNGQRHEGGIVERQTETSESHSKMSSATRYINAGKAKNHRCLPFPLFPGPRAVSVSWTGLNGPGHLALIKVRTSYFPKENLRTLGRQSKQIILPEPE